MEQCIHFLQHSQPCVPVVLSRASTTMALLIKKYIPEMEYKSLHRIVTISIQRHHLIKKLLPRDRVVD